MLYHARMVVDERLHLPDLLIENFRGIESLTLPHLGHVTLLTGKNGVGKSTVLEAVRAYAAQGHPAILNEVLTGRREFSTFTDEEGEFFVAPDWSALFHGRSASKKIEIIVGSQKKKTKDARIKIQRSSLPDEFESRVLARRRRFNRGVPKEERSPKMIACEPLGPGLLTDERMAVLWDEVALTDDESQALQALRLVYSDAERVAVIGGGQPPIRTGGRRVVVRIKDQDIPVPLRSLGDGAARLFGLALALANSQDGFLVIDEAENGIYHSIQRNYWRMVLQAAHDNNVQVIATTHSWDCVRAFAQEAVENDEVNGVLIRLEKDDDGIYPIEYSEKDLKVCAEQGIEVR